jgi:hypothetical protein
LSVPDHERQPDWHAAGEWRDLTDDELIELFKLIENFVRSEAKGEK